MRSSVVTPRGLPNWFFLRKEAKVPCETIPDRPPVPDDTANRNLWEILERTKTTFKLDDAHKDVILLLGNTGKFSGCLLTVVEKYCHSHNDVNLQLKKFQLVTTLQVRARQL